MFGLEVIAPGGPLQGLRRVALGEEDTLVEIGEVGPAGHVVALHGTLRGARIELASKAAI